MTTTLQAQAKLAVPQGSASRSSRTDKLALLGGTPVAAPLCAPPWPPRSEATAQRLLDVYRSGKWSFNGPYEQELCDLFATHHGARHGIFMANGTVTLQLALQALGVGPGDEVIVPALTWLATAAAAIYLGATPVFVDIEPTTLCLDPKQVEAAITPRTRAIVPVHLYGGMADLEAILAIAKRHHLAVVEDCAHAHGGVWNGRGVGSWGDIGSFSFQESKTVASGEGGMCLTNDDVLAEKLYCAKHIGYSPSSVQGTSKVAPPAGLLCHNFRGTEFQAVLLVDQTRELGQLMATYNANAARLEARLADVEGVRVQSRGRLADVQSYYSWGFVMDQGALGQVPLPRVLEAIGAEGLGMGGTYGPVYQHPLWNLPETAYRIAAGGCPVADGIAKQHVALMSHIWLGSDNATIDLIGDIIAKVAHNAGHLLHV